MKTRYLLGTVICAGLAGAPLQAQEAGGVEPPLWLISCSNTLDPGTLTCEFSQSIVLTEENRRLAAAFFVKDVGAPGLTGVFVVPTGLHIPAGVAVSVDGAKVGDAVVDTCTPEECRATASIGDEWLAAMRGGREMTLEVEAADRRPVSFTFQLEDFAVTEALMP